MLRKLIVNADDFGLSAGINRGIIQAFERGIVTSASLMVRAAAAAAAADYAQKNPRLSIGLHLDLAEWIYRDDGGWLPLYEVVDVGDAAAVKGEVHRQLDVFIDLVGQPPTHLDSHQHLHRNEPLRSIALGLAGELNVPLRHLSPTVQYRGDFYGQTAKGGPLPDAIGVQALIATLRGLQTGVTELGCHPGFADDVETVYRAQRAQEVVALCDPRLPVALKEERIELINFRGL